MGDNILVVPREKLFEDMETPQGFATERLEQLLGRIREYRESADRKAAEEDPSLKQIIPYMVLCCGSKLFLMRRFDNQDEDRLRNLYSLGVGGHIEPAEDRGTARLAGPSRGSNASSARKSISPGDTGLNRSAT